MKKNTKGFTLIELLAVIVILAVIALIASPIILNIISSARESSQARSVENYATAIQDGIASAMYSTKYTGGEITVNNTDGTLLEGTVELAKISYSGQKITCSKIEYTNETGYLTLEGCYAGNNTTLTFNYTNDPSDANSGKAVKVEKE